jgi:hypothetical protein
MHERTNIRLSRADRSTLEAAVADRNSPQKHVWRARIVLLTADGHGTAEIKGATGKAKTVIWRWQELPRGRSRGTLARKDAAIADSSAAPGNRQTRCRADAFWSAGFGKPLDRFGDGQSGGHQH